MTEKDKQIAEIRGDITKIRAAVGLSDDGTAEAKGKPSIASRVAELEQKTVFLGHELSLTKNESTGLVTEGVFAKVALDVIKLELPSAIRLNEERILQLIGLEYTNTAGGFLDVPRRIRRPSTDNPEPVTGGTPLEQAGRLQEQARRAQRQFDEMQQRAQRAQREMGDAQQQAQRFMTQIRNTATAIRDLQQQIGEGGSGGGGTGGGTGSGGTGGGRTGTGGTGA
ncbi:hypothetical protein QWJ26_07360 [Streptomyces sp. CSDS2]|uniref:hypothetical protein n=1 Tax=Streptomyces sp. CSDS2 TaxID=3055051 RepID=UPI0025AECF74|nr:hypothetical protein [Streptomyces sp. CSDS2]MDN3259636.1 hypothetical protein [Streptomyces sp. CSDS2]